jgi:hypothetical protein
MFLRLWCSTRSSLPIYAFCGKTRSAILMKTGSGPRRSPFWASNVRRVGAYSFAHSAVIAALAAVRAWSLSLEMGDRQCRSFVGRNTAEWSFPVGNWTPGNSPMLCRIWRSISGFFVSLLISFQMLPNVRPYGCQVPMRRS